MFFPLFIHMNSVCMRSVLCGLVSHHDVVNTRELYPCIDHQTHNLTTSNFTHYLLSTLWHPGDIHVMICKSCTISKDAYNSCIYRVSSLTKEFKFGDIVFTTIGRLTVSRILNHVKVELPSHISHSTSWSVIDSVVRCAVHHSLIMALCNMW